MADEKKSEKSEKTIEMRLAELEDKVAKIHITEEELKAYHKVSRLIGGAGAPAEDVGQIGSTIYPCITPRGINRLVTRGIPRINRGINDCNECGPCGWGGMGGGGMGGGGFGGFGM
jgi:hypothetical protein